jgi:hypothetical protein
MERITHKQLQAVVDRINRETGSPLESWTRDPDGHLQANIGNYHLDSAYSGYSLARHVTLGGGETSVLAGYVSKREIYEKMHAFLRGIQAARESN